MLARVRNEMKTIVVAVVTAILTTLLIAGAPAIAHGVKHALFAHNAGKVDGKDAADFVARNKAASATVLNDGTLYHSSHSGTTSERTTTGHYTITWPNKLKMPSECSGVATPLYLNGSPFFTTVEGGGTLLRVQVYNAAGDYADLAFNVVAVC